MRSEILVLLFLNLTCISYSYAQYGENDFVRYNVKDGLSDNYATVVAQDDWGYIWIGTEIGLNRFDGNGFQNYYQNAPEHLLTSSNIRKLINLDNHRLAIVGRNGFQILNTKNYKIFNYLIPDTTAFITTRNLVWDISELPDSSFAVTTSSGFYVFNTAGEIEFRHDAYGLEDIGNKKILYGRTIFSMPDDDLIVYVEEDGLAHYDHKRKTFNTIPAANNKWKEFSHPAESNEGLWNVKFQISDHEYIFFPKADSIIYWDHSLRRRIVSPLPFPWSEELTWESKVTFLSNDKYAVSSGYSGFFIFSLDRSTGRITFQPRKWLEKHKINSIFQDNSKRLWVGTTEGLLQQKLRPGLIEKFHWPVDDFSNKGYVDGLLHKGYLYLGRYSRDVGLVVIDTHSMQVVKQIQFYGKGNGWNEILSIQMYHPDTLWLGTYEGLLWFDTKTHQYGQVPNMHKPPNDNLSLIMMEPIRSDGYGWMLSYLDGAVARYHPASRSFDIFTEDTKPALPFNKVKGIAYDSFGDVWISGHSLTKWNNRENYFDTLISVYAGANKYNEDIIVLAADLNGSLWFHSAENGLLEYKIKQKKFVPYSIKDGLPSDVLRCFSPIVDHTLWIGSHNHLTRLDTETKKMEVYGYQEGLPQRMPISRKMILDPSRQNLYMFYNDEVIRFPVHPKTYSNTASDIIIQDVIVNNELTYFFPDQTIKLKPSEKNISIHYSIIDFEDNPEYKFDYKINGSKQWTSLGKQRSLNLNNLSPGSYLVTLRASGKSGDQRTKSLSFIIGLPLWKTSWFIVLCTLLVAALVYTLYRRRVSQVKQKADLDKLLSQTEMKALHAQMNPHFIFNSLNSIREMILNEDNKEASRFLSKFAHLIRVTLDQSGQSFISLRNSIDYLERYIEMEKIRNNNFECHITVDPDLEMDETIMPPMLIQPFIENAIWHGTVSRNHTIDITIHFKKQKKELICTVEDNGIGIEKSLSNKSPSEKLHHSVGISNIRSRIQLLNKKHNLHSSILVEDKATLKGGHEQGTRVTLRLPLEMAEE